MKENKYRAFYESPQRLCLFLGGSLAICCIVIALIYHAGSFERVYIDTNPMATKNNIIINKGTENKIPKLLHHIYLSGFDAFLEETSKPDAAIIPDWHSSCIKMHPHWTYKFWNMSSALELLETQYPDILKMFNEAHDCGVECNPIVLKGDIFRIVVLHAFGGLYLDMDVECWLPADSMLEENTPDVVLQGTADFEGVTNAIVAGTKGHPLFRRALDMMKQRMHNKTMLVFEKTGPNLLHDAAKSMNGDKNKEWKLWEGGDFEMTFKDEKKKVVKSKLKSYPIGTFFTPCWAFDRPCYAELLLNRGMGKTRERNVGMHRYSGSWTKNGNEVSIHTESGARAAICDENNK